MDWPPSGRAPGGESGVVGSRDGIESGRRPGAGFVDDAVGSPRVFGRATFRAYLGHLVAEASGVVVLIPRRWWGSVVKPGGWPPMGYRWSHARPRPVWVLST
ncbi:hypothetical protein GCM10022226_61580 [Sphaerisporangium flaviroseum]|uniref:Uncharacterized protein n=1 Tax=Sphaerisporangium flaviroseum TaxID=509199 RepID=A0ABP7J267_9ACTN